MISRNGGGSRRRAARPAKERASGTPTADEERSARMRALLGVLARVTAAPRGQVGSRPGRGVRIGLRISVARRWEEACFEPEHPDDKAEDRKQR